MLAGLGTGRPKLLETNACVLVIEREACDLEAEMSTAVFPLAGLAWFDHGTERSQALGGTGPL